jgi:hypothetical protein
LIALIVDVHSPRQRSFDRLGIAPRAIAGCRRIRERPMLASQPIRTDVSVVTTLARRRIPSVRPNCLAGARMVASSRCQTAKLPAAVFAAVELVSNGRGS